MILFYFTLVCKYAKLTKVEVVELIYLRIVLYTLMMQFLTELDGVEVLTGVFVFAATR